MEKESAPLTSPSAQKGPRFSPVRNWASWPGVGIHGVVLKPPTGGLQIRRAADDTDLQVLLLAQNSGFMRLIRLHSDLKRGKRLEDLLPGGRRARSARKKTFGRKGIRGREEPVMGTPDKGAKRSKCSLSLEPFKPAYPGTETAVADEP